MVWSVPKLPANTHASYLKNGRYPCGNGIDEDKIGQGHRDTNTVQYTPTVTDVFSRAADWCGQCR
jgi:hypothetical protein